MTVIAERLLAHARLCEQIARECWNEDTAEKLRRMARDCTLAAGANRTFAGAKQPQLALITIEFEVWGSSNSLTPFANCPAF